jgi:hypothetical protein
MGGRDMNMFNLKNPQFLFSGIVAALAAVRPAAAGPVHAVVELFTSQGCSSCPPADKILSDLAKDPDVLAVSLPIDYWNYIGWRDTLASPLFTARQKAYAAASGRGQVYTPQVIVNGLKDAVGGNREAIAQAEKQTLATSGVMSVPLDVSVKDNTIHVTVGGAPNGAPGAAGVYLLALARAQTVEIKRGENAGSTLTYSNVVRAIIKIGDWKGAKIDLTADTALTRVDGADSFAIIVQSGDRAQPGAMLAAWGS